MTSTTSVKEFSNNATYSYMASMIKDMSCESIKVSTYPLISMVQNSKGKFNMYSSEVCNISLPDGSHINFKSYEGNVDISRIISNTKGCGSILMKIVLFAYFSAVVKISDSVGDLILECTGSVGIGSNKRDTPVAQQTSFFRKFGFRKVGKYNPNHIHMSLHSNDDMKKTANEITDLLKKLSV